MKLYTLPVVLRRPSADAEDMYLAEIPVLPGCRAWREMAADALANMKDVAAASIESYNSR